MGHGGRRANAGRKPRDPNALPTRVGVTGVHRDAVSRDNRARETFEVVPVTPMATVTQGGKFKDAFVNYSHRLGVGAQNVLSSSSASFNPLSRIRTLIEWMYRGQFVCKNAVDVIAEDMTREGIEIVGKMKPKDIETIEAKAIELNVWEGIRDVIKWSRLYGGAVGFMLIEGQDPGTPFKLESVGKDQFYGIYPFDRWMIDPSLELLVTDMKSGQLGKPQYYRVTADAPALPRIKMHYSRVLRMIGNKQPYWSSIQENLWGLSVLETIQDRITAFDLGSTGAAQLIDKSFLRTYKIEGLKELIGSNSLAYQGLLQLLEVMRAMQTIEGVTLMDKSDELEKMEHGAFSGIAEILVEFRQQLSGALQMPMTKLFGTSPGGLNATGESDMRNYYDMIKGQQITHLLYFVTTVYKLLAATCGIKWPDGCKLQFKPLWQDTATEKSEQASKNTDTVIQATEAGLVSNKVALQELKQQSSKTGVWTNITEEDINKAEDEPVPAAELAMGPGGGMPGSTKLPGAPKPAGGKAFPKPAAGAGKPAPGGDKGPPRDKKQRDQMWSGQAGYSMEHRPNWLSESANELPAAVHPGARPFDDGVGYDTALQGLPIHIENRKGTVRRSRDPSNQWEATMAADYGYVKGTGSAEGPDEGMDVFVGPDHDSDKVYIINQRDLKTGQFDEHKCMLAFSDRNRAASAYVSSYSDLQGFDRVMSMHICTVDEFKQWLRTGNMREPYGTKQ